MCEFMQKIFHEKDASGGHLIGSNVMSAAELIDFLR
jgi:hypothetical protein